MNKIKYLIRKRALGDVLWIEPVIRQLAAHGKPLTVYTKYPELFDNFPDKQVHFKKDLPVTAKMLIWLEKKLRLRRLTVNLDDAYEKRPDMHFLHAYQTEADLPLTMEYPRLYLSLQEKNDRRIPEKYVVLHLESFSDKKFRQVYGVNWEQVVAALHEQGYKVVQVGMQSNEIPGTVRVATTLREMISLLHHAAYFIGIDSGPSHIAASLAVPALVFFGAINPHHRHFSSLFRGILAKQPCEYDLEQYRVINEKCLHCNRAAGRDLAVCSLYSTDDVLSKISQLMKSI